MVPMRDTNADIPALVKELRERLRLTQEQFAQKVGACLPAGRSPTAP
jgi:DNA-binding XRE family transcriptional regulator